MAILFDNATVRIHFSCPVTSPSYFMFMGVPTETSECRTVRRGRCLYSHSVARRRLLIINSFTNIYSVFIISLFVTSFSLAIRSCVVFSIVRIFEFLFSRVLFPQPVLRVEVCVLFMTPRTTDFLCYYVQLACNQQFFL